MIRVALILILFFSTGIVSAQQDSTSTSSKQTEKKEEKKGFDPKRITYGGGIGGTIGTVTAINVSPIVAYRFTDRFYAGPRLIYNYFGTRFFSYSNYGFGILGRYFPKGRFFAHAEYQEMYVRIDESRRYRAPAMLLGAGYYNRPVTFSVLYDILWTIRSPQPSPIQINFGLMF